MNASKIKFEDKCLISILIDRTNRNFNNWFFIYFKLGLLNIYHKFYLKYFNFIKNLVKDKISTIKA